MIGESRSHDNGSGGHLAVGHLSPPAQRQKEKLKMNEGEKSRNLIRENMLRVINDRSGLSARNQRKMVEDQKAKI